MNLLVAENLRVRREGRTVLEIPRFTVAEGEILAVIGPNGAGKSTLLQALALLVEAEMSYTFAGRTARLPAEALELRRQMAVVFQQPLLLDGTVYDNVAMGLRLRGLREPAVRSRVSLWLDRFGVGGLARRHARQLSGGEAQRVSLARALALHPRLLFLDEPFGALDVLTRSALVQDLRQLLSESGVTALFVTHDFTEIPPLAGRMAVLLDGRVVQTGAPREVFAGPATPAVAALVRAAADLIRALDA